MENSNDKFEKERSAIGKKLYDYVTFFSIVIGKHKVLYYFLSFTWGVIYTLIGLICSLILLCCGCKYKKYHKTFYQEFKENWGGVSLGMNFVICKNSGESTKAHEYGHTHQNALLGPFFIFLVAIPSAIRYWYRNIKHISSPSYYAIWFEGSASDIGEAVVEYEESKTK